MKSALRIFILLLYCVIALAIAYVVIPWVTVHGIGLTPDSVTYIAAARNLLAGNGLYVGSTPMTHYPPVYSLLLAGSGLFHADIMLTTRWLHTLLFGANAILFMFSIYFGTRRNLIAMFTGGVLYFSSPAILYVHSYALSESPFIFFALLTFLLLAQYFASKKEVFLLAASIVMGLGIATRYVGISLLPPFIISCFLFNYRPLRKTLVTVLWSTTIAILPLAAWSIRNIILSQTFANRKFVFHPVDLNRIQSMIDTFHNFILPPFQNRWINTIESGLLFLVLCYLIFQILRWRSAFSGEDLKPRVMLFTGITFTISFILVLFLSISFMDAGTSTDERILLPAILALTFAVFAIVDVYSKISLHKAALPIFLLCVAFIIRLNIPGLIERADLMHTEGMGFNAAFWNNSPTIRELDKLPSDTKIYSNGFDVIRIKTWRETFMLPRKYDSASTLKNPDYANELDAMCTEVNSNKAIIVYLDQVNWREYFPDEQELIDTCKLPLLIEEKDGAIYGVVN